MRLQEWLWDHLYYRFWGCYNSENQGHIFNYIESVIPKSFQRKFLSDLGCGDGKNTLRIKKAFKTKGINGYDRNKHLVKRAVLNGINAKVLDLEKYMPKGEQGSFIMSLHHLKNKEVILRKAKENFKQLFLCEPCLTFRLRLIDGGKPLSKKDWISLFDKVFGNYQLYEYLNLMMVFYERKK